MDLDGVDPFRLFDLPRDAPLETIRRRYRELALAYHPDRRGGDDVEQARKFSLVCAAYEAILEAREAEERNQTFGPCRECGLQRALVPRLDGVLVCADCLGRPAQVSLLPPPAWVVIKCTFSVLCLIGAITCFLLLLASRVILFGVLSLGLGLAGLAVLATLGFMIPIVRDHEIARTSHAKRKKRRRHR